MKLLMAIGGLGMTIVLSSATRASSGVPLPAGTYNFEDSAGNTWDGGFARWSNDPYVFEYSYNNNSDQQFIWNGSTLKESQTGSYAFSSGNALGLGTSADTFTIVSSGSGYTIRDNATGLYVNSPFAQSPPNKLAMSSTPTVWTAVLQSGGGGGGGTPLATGTYNFEDSSGNTWDGGFARAGNSPYVYEYSYNDGPDQQFVWNGSTLCESASGAYAYNSGNTVALGSTAGAFSIVSSGGGYTIRDTASGLYVNSPFATSPPNKLALSSTQTIWQAVPVGGTTGGTTTIDDTDPAVIYSRSESNGNWNAGAGASDYDGDEHYNNACQNPPQSLTPVQGPMAVVNFNGTGIQLIGKRGNNFGIGAWAVDGGPLTTVDAYDPAANVYQQTLVSVSGLAAGSHTLSYQVTCNKNAASSNYYQVIDAYKIDGSPLDPSSAQVGAWDTVTLGGAWSSGENPSTDLSGGQIWSGAAGNTISWTFTGSLIEMYGRPDVGDGYFDVYIDGNEVARNVDSHYSVVDNDLLTAYMMWAMKVSPGTHTITVVVTGTEDAYNEAEDSGQKYLVQFDEFLAFP